MCCQPLPINFSRYTSRNTNPSVIGLFTEKFTMCRKEAFPAKKGGRNERKRLHVTKLSLEILKKRVTLSCVHFARNHVSRLRRHCIAYYLMDGFSLCSADSLTAGPPDCTLRPFSAAPWLVVLEGGTPGEREASPGGWSGVEESSTRGAGGRAVASLHNEQDAGTPRPPFCLHQNPLVSP